MKLRFNSAVSRTAVGVTASLVLVLFFQNCGKAGFDADLDESSYNGSSDAALTAKYGSATAAKVAGIPFAFDASFDQIAYNSCADENIRNNSAFFSIKAGAYSTGGIKLSNEFYEYVDQRFSPIYPEPAITNNQYKEFLADSPANNGAIPAMAIRVKNSLDSVFSSSNRVTTGVDVLPMVSTLTDGRVMESLVGKGNTATYFPFSEEFRVMEATLTLNSNEAAAEQFRSTLTDSGGVLTLGYMDTKMENYQIRSPSNESPLRTAYGKGYQFSFSQYPVSGGRANNPHNVIASLTEYDLSSPATTGRQWNCNNRMVVVRAQDAARCPAHNYADLKNATIRSKLEMVRRQLRADQWDVNVSLGCAVPKGNVSCYKEEVLNGNPVGVEYDLTKECFRSTNAVYTTTPKPTARCAQFITICTRD